MKAKLFEPTKLGTLELKNRVVMAPMTRSRADASHVPTPSMATYYEQRSGAGLLITEGTAPSADGAGYPRIPGIYNERQAAAWKPVTEAVHRKGSRIFLQMMHTGRVGNLLNQDPGSRLVAPSSHTLGGQMYTDEKGMQPHGKPHELSTEEVRHVVREFEAAARLAKNAGFDGVEVHGANGYLVEQFLRPTTNTREDEYGGEIQGRSRFLFEVVDAVARVFGKDRVGIRLSPYGVFNEMPAYPEMDADYQFVAQGLQKSGIAYLHLVDHAAMGAPEVPLSLKHAMREAFRGTLILSGGYDLKRAEADLATGFADLVAFGRPFLANPDLVDRLRSGKPLAQPDPSTFYTPGDKGYIDYPTAG